MSWAAGRRALIIGGIVAILLAIAGFVLYSIFNQAPSCADKKQNQDEEGIDCGGSCTYLCAERAGEPLVRFARELRQNGRTDVIAYVENPNASAARAVKYTVEVYGEDRTSLAKKTGTIDLPPRDYGVIPLYIPGIYSGEREAVQAFLTFDDPDTKWFSLDEPLVTLKADSPLLAGTTEAPRVTAFFTNPSVTTVRKAKVIAAVFDAEGNVIAASQTVLPDLAPGAEAEAVFTWNEPFAAPVSRIDARPLLFVPAP